MVLLVSSEAHLYRHGLASTRDFESGFFANDIVL